MEISVGQMMLKVCTKRTMTAQLFCEHSLHANKITVASSTFDSVGFNFNQSDNTPNKTICLSEASVFLTKYGSANTKAPS